MEVREATADDGPTVRSLALRSMEASYSLSPSTIEGAIRQWYGVEEFAEKLEDDEVQLLIAEEDGEPVAFSESVLVDSRGDIHWLHVAAMYRGQGIGHALYEETRQRLEDAGAETIRGLVLADNTEGNRFWEKRGLTKVGEGSVEIDGTAFVENIYVDHEGSEIQPIVVEDRELYVDRSDSDRGSKGAFYTVYSEEDRENKYGYYCGSCESLVTSMDSMGRLECDSCGNQLKPTRWDAAYM
ncbi:GNAT family N-acetyltransferase [Natronomonas sp. CBA1123]|uniref:GNAT family N-acetyltransferase n=1 Tax=Natronomonas sp. CBA1123 TaxID=2668070 RepID=UPI0012E9CAAB|nr:GNAT family N-acetyltransferase [Natronomonas sp. CBA1123]MUV87594.1 GNAT family N-acetyltransferase [Natronomonas sp. CBA1123]